MTSLLRVIDVDQWLIDFRIKEAKEFLSMYRSFSDILVVWASAIPIICGLVLLLLIAQNRKECIKAYGGKVRLVNLSIYQPLSFL